MPGERLLSEPWVAAVLTGGSSTRMGRDKASLPVDGVPMARRVAAALLDAGAAAVVAVGAPVAGLEVVADVEPGQGPLGAVVAALRWAQGRPVLVAACDLVAPDAATFAVVTAALGGHEAAVPVVDGRRQPLAAAYDPSALPVLERAYAAGTRSISDAIRGLDVVEVAGLAAAALADADEPGDLPG